MPSGWIYRAMIQKNQPRAGLQQTVDAFAARFGNDPAQLKTLTWLRAQLALQQGAAKQAARFHASANNHTKALTNTPAVATNT